MSAKDRQQTRSRRQGRSQLTWHALFLVLLCVGVYLNTLGHDFVFDDEALILQNPQVTEKRWGEIFGAQGYRPVRTFTYALNHALGGARPFGYHLFNILLHALNTLLLYRLFREWLESRLAPTLAGLFFGLHPVQTAAVAYVSGRKDLLATAFILAGLLLYTRFRKSGQHRWLALALFSFLLAMLSKEVAIVFPALLLVTEMVLASKNGGWIQGLVRTVRAHSLGISVAFPLAALGVYYALFMTGATRMTGFWGGSWAANLGTGFKLFAHYLKTTLFPHPLIADYKGDVFPVSTGFSEPATLAAVAVFCGYLAVAVWSLRKGTAVGVGLLWFLITLSPVLHLIPFHEIAADHFLYLPLAGISLAAGRLLATALSAPRYRLVSITAAALVFLAFGLRAIDRNRDWKNTRTLWESTLAAAPGSYRANVNLGRLYFGSDHQLGITHTRRALELMPGDWMAQSNLGSMLFVQARDALQKGDLATAYRLTEESIRLLLASTKALPRNGPAWSNLGNCYRQLAQLAQRQGDSSRARELRRTAESFYETALRKDSRREVKATWYNLANLQSDRSDYRAAIASLHSFLQYFPDHVGGNQSMGRNLLLAGRHSAAIPWLQMAVRKGAGPAGIQMLAVAYRNSGRSAEAIPLLESLVAQTPSPGLHLELAMACYQTGNLVKALTWLEKVTASPADPRLKRRARGLIETIQAGAPTPVPAS